MKIESLTLQNFRCFGPEPQTLLLSEDITAFVGTNGTGKTAAMQALLRVFGISEEQRRIRYQDFHVSHEEKSPPQQRELVIEVILVFPELDGAEVEGAETTVPHFFQHLSVTEDGQLKCRFRLEAKWVDDGSAEGAIESRFWGVRTLSAILKEEDKEIVSALDRAAVQVVYIPATRDGVAQVSQLLRGRLWRAIKWTNKTKDEISRLGQEINKQFADVSAIKKITQTLTSRWEEVHGGGTHATPALRPVEPKFEELVRKIGVSFFPDEAGKESGIEDLSDGQRSLFHIALTTAILDVEAAIVAGKHNKSFEQDAISLPVLTIVALEEPENCLAPFYLSRILHQMNELAKQPGAQIIVSSHSASILSRIPPEAVRYFRLDDNRNAQVRSLTLPPEKEEAGKYVREAVRAFPELYFARFVIFGEGDSEEIVLPRIAAAMDLPIDRTFVAIVPLGGRHVNHFWRLVHDLEIPHATLLDLDLGRQGGGWGRIKYVLENLIQNGYEPAKLLTVTDDKAASERLSEMTGWGYGDSEVLKSWKTHLENEAAVYFSARLDLDWSMLKRFPTYYQTLEEGEYGPKGEVEAAKTAVLGDKGKLDLYEKTDDESFLWYRYLFLGRGKPTSHLRALAIIPETELKEKAPAVLQRLLNHVAQQLAMTDDAAT